MTWNNSHVFARFAVCIGVQQMWRQTCIFVVLRNDSLLKGIRFILGCSDVFGMHTEPLYGFYHALAGGFRLRISPWHPFAAAALSLAPRYLLWKTSHLVISIRSWKEIFHINSVGCIPRNDTDHPAWDLEDIGENRSGFQRWNTRVWPICNLLLYIAHGLKSAS